MEQIAPRSLKWAYALTVLAAILPVGLTSSGWVALTIGAGPLQAIPVVGPLAFLVLGLYRIYLVVRVPGTLDSRRAMGVARVCRVIGVFGLYFGAAIGVLNLSSRPLLRLLISRPTESGAELYVAGVFLALLGGVGLLAIVLFEFSRLQAFEQHAREFAP